jgi:ABC-type uncharacterized transport system fused permease/ATPase subunit
MILTVHCKVSTDELVNTMDVAVELVVKEPVITKLAVNVVTVFVIGRVVMVTITEVLVELSTELETFKAELRFVPGVVASK